MASRHSAARPKRAGENFARTHHNDEESDPKRVKFDVRNPSILAPDAREDDAILEADVIGATGGTKRGAVNLDGYDSDSDNETFNARAEARKKGEVNILEQLDNYDAKSSGPAGGAAAEDDDDDEDMFAANDDEADTRDKATEGTNGSDSAGNKKKKNVQFLDSAQIDGQEDTSRTGGTVRLDDQESSDDEADVELAIQEEGIDEEVGRGGLKRNAPKVEAFNLKDEMEEGRFDQEGNYLRKAGDPDAVHDTWLEGTSKKEMRKAAAAHEKREAEARKQRLQEDEVLVSELLNTLILKLEKAETPLEALARLGRSVVKPKKVPKWKLKKMNKGGEGMEVDAETTEDPKQVEIKASINAITDAADKLLSRDYEDIYERERELLVREYRKETGEDWVEPEAPAEASEEKGQPQEDGTFTWEFRWVDGRDDGATQGPFDGATMKAWQDAGYFGEGVEFRRANSASDWTSSITSFT